MGAKRCLKETLKGEKRYTCILKLILLILLVAAAACQKEYQRDQMLGANPSELGLKYQYCQVNENTFQDAKDATENALNTCPVEVIRRFINRSWRWMSAYRMGLTGKAAQWAIRKQKGHRCASRTALMHLDAVINCS